MAPRLTPDLPVPLERLSRPFALDTPGWWLVLSDVHIPYHDPAAVRHAVKEAKRRKARGVVLNGDTMDFHALSRFDKSPDDARYNQEILAGRQFLAYLRGAFPRGRLVFKDGNHEERLLHYLWGKAPELFGLDLLTTPSLLEFERHGVEHVTDRRLITLGGLNVIHGHEYRGGGSVNPARGLFLRAMADVLCGHFHKTDHYHDKDITGTPRAAWATGCACGLTPYYLPLNRWTHGYALVEVGKKGGFVVENVRL